MQDIRDIEDCKLFDINELSDFLRIDKDVLKKEYIYKGKIEFWLIDNRKITTGLAIKHFLGYKSDEEQALDNYINNGSRAEICILRTKIKMANFDFYPLRKTFENMLGSPMYLEKLSFYTGIFMAKTEKYC